MKSLKFKSFSELYDYCSTCGLSSGFNSQPELKFSTAKKVIDLPLTRRSGTQMEVLRMVVPNGNGPAIKAIAWQMLFGKSTRTYYIWYLFDFLLTHKIYTQRGQSLFNLLMVYNAVSASARQNAMNWNYCYPSLRKILGAESEVFKKLREDLLWLVPEGISLKDTKELISASKATIRFKRPPEVARIGVGYKDKGSLPRPGNEYSPDEITPFCEPDQYKCWNKFISNWKQFKSNLLKKG